jgi:hypothetical protein
VGYRAHLSGCRRRRRCRNRLTDNHNTRDQTLLAAVVLQSGARFGKPRHRLFDPLNGRRVIGRRQDAVTELIQACTQEGDVRRDVIQDVDDVRLVKIPGALPLDARIGSFLEPARKVLDRSLTRAGRERVVLISRSPLAPRSRARPQTNG